MNLFQDKKENSGKENDLYSFPPFDSFHGESPPKTPPLVLELIQLPLLSENFEQMPVGARGWYASAILSAMMMMSYYGSSNSGSKMTKGTDFLGEDLRQACTSMLPSKTNDGYKNNVFLELGSGTIGLGGMTLAWIVAQHEHNAKSKDAAATRRNTVVVTDYDHDCLEQLERNAVGVRKAFREYFSAVGSNDTEVADNDTVSNGIIPDIGVEKLDWTEYDKDQSPLLPDCASIDDENSISFVCGAALVYMEDTAACVDQVAKILKRHPKAVVWVVQWPRDGWFSIFQQELQSSKFQSEDCNIRVQKFGPTSSPDMFSAEILQLAQKLMPGNTHQEVEMNIKDLRAIRITNSVS